MEVILRWNGGNVQQREMQEALKKGDGFVIIQGLWEKRRIPCSFATVYPSSDLNRKRQQWELLKISIILVGYKSGVSLGILIQIEP